MRTHQPPQRLTDASLLSEILETIFNIQHIDASLKASRYFFFFSEDKLSSSVLNTLTIHVINEELGGSEPCICSVWAAARWSRFPQKAPRKLLFTDLHTAGKAEAEPAFGEVKAGAGRCCRAANQEVCASVGAGRERENFS